ncbi:MAG: leucine-rich repeat protein [Paludibacteraceae bacterium]|nr:leucine-rich repeat protein [Paludibacteraceae bacterium]
MRKLKSFWALLCLLLVSSSSSVVFAASDDMGTVGSGTWIFSASTGKLLINCPGSMGTSTPGWRTSSNFALTDIKSVEIGEGVTDIAANAFYQCRNLTSVTIKGSITNVKEKAFRESGITSISLPSTVKTIGEDAFWNSQLTSFNVPASCTSIGTSAVTTSKISKFTSSSTSFGVGSDNEYLYQKSNGKIISGSATITSLSLGEEVKSIGDYAFSYATKLTTILNGKNCTSFGEAAFQSSSALKTMYLNGSAATFGDSAFPSTIKSTCIATCVNSTTVTNLKKYVDQTYSAVCGTDLWWRVYEDQTTLRFIGSGSMTSFASSTAAPWNGIKSKIKTISFGSAATSIGNYAFYGMSNLTTVTGSVNGLTSIGTSAFESCSKLSTVPFSSMTALKTIGMDAFYGSSALTSANLSYTKLTTLGLRAFCLSAISSVSLPSSVTTLNDYCFASTKLTTFSLPSAVTSIGTGIVYNNTTLTAITGGSSTYTVSNNGIYKGNVLVQGCKNTVLKSSTTELASRSLYGQGITAITIPSAVSTIASDALAENTFTSIIDQRTDASKVTLTTSHFNASTKSSCKVQVTSSDIKTKYTAAGFTAANVMVTSCGTNLTWSFNPSNGELTISGTGTTITSYSSAASYPWNAIRTQIKKVIIPTSVTNIPAYAFDGCTNLAWINASGSVYFNNVTSIGDYAFRNTALTKASGYSNFYLPTSLNTLGAGVFSGCSSLSTLTISSSNTNFAANAGCITSKTGKTLYVASGATISVPSTVITINSSAFSTGNIKTLTIPSSVTSINTNAFSGASSITTLNYATTTAPTSYGNLSKTGCTVHVQIANQSSAKTVYNYFKTTNSFSNVVYDYCGTTLKWAVASNKLTITNSNEAGSTGAMWDFSAADAANMPWYSSRTSITTVAFSGNVTKIGAYAFSGATSLSSITLPTGLTTIGNYALQSTKISSITIPATVSSIGVWGTNSIQTVKVEAANANYTSQDKDGNELNMLMDKSATNLFLCPSTTANVALPNTMTTVNTGAFNGAVGKLTIPSTVTTMNSWPTSAASIHAANVPTAATVPSTLKSVKVYASTATVQDKYKGLGFTNVVVGKSCGSNASYFFENGVLTIVGSGGVSSAPWLTDANVGAAKIKRVVVEAGITSITVSNSFKNCVNLTSVKFPDGMTNLYPSAFDGCLNLKSIIVPSTFITQKNSNSVFANSGVEKITVRPCSGTLYAASTDANGDEKNILVYDPASTAILKYAVTPDIPSFVKGVETQCIKTQSVTDLNIPANVTEIRTRAFSNVTIKNIYSASTATISSTEFDADTKSKANVYVASETIKAKFVAAGFTESKIKVATGRCGADMYYYVNGKKLIIFGGGAMYTGSSLDKTWGAKASTFTSIEFKGTAITSISASAFASCTAVKGAIEIPASVTSIGAAAFGSDLITKVTYNSETPAAMANNAFTSNTYGAAALIVPDAAREKFLDATGWENFGGVQTNEEVANPYDINKDGKVNSLDVNAVIKNF